MTDPLHLVGIMAGIYHNGKYLMMVRAEVESEAPMTLSFVSGSTEVGPERDDVLEDTLHREVMEEVGVTVVDLVYVRSRAFTLTRGVPVIIAEFICKWDAGTARVADPNEVESVAWMTVAEVNSHPKSPSWTIDSMAAMEAKRIELGW
ncbi:MAG: NUDIX domain-containing protein [Chloroflexi bacterium]|nr:NUDIX domain-containing protein [Chloroflexota bacterium]